MNARGYNGPLEGRTHHGAFGQVGRQLFIGGHQNVGVEHLALIPWVGELGHGIAGMSHQMDMLGILQPESVALGGLLRCRRMAAREERQ